MIYPLVFKIKEAFARKRAKKFKKLVEKISGFEGEKLERLVALFTDKNFSLFLEFLDLTIYENTYILSSIDILDDTRRADAIRYQQQTQGLRLVRSLVEDMINRAQAFQFEQKDKRNLDD